MLINLAEFQDKVYGCWLGKAIGGTLGTPVEGRRDLMHLTGYTHGHGLMPNDDFDWALVWLRAVQEHGTRALTAEILGDYWLSYVTMDAHEYAISKANQRLGLPPPLCGEYRNRRWRDSNGAWIRGEFWACLFPGLPDHAIGYMFEDACVDHGNGEGTWGSLFMAAMHSAAFVLTDASKLVQIGLAKIPETSRVRQSVELVMRLHGEHVSWQEAREQVVADSVKDLGWFAAPANIAFIIIGLLWGDGDFGRSILITTNCGDDTDSTAGSLAALLGIMHGATAIPDDWSAVVGDDVTTMMVDSAHMAMAGPRTITELARQVAGASSATLGALGWPVAFHAGPSDVASAFGDLTADRAARALWARSPWAVVRESAHTRVTVDFGGPPEVRAGQPFPLRVTVQNLGHDPRLVQLHLHLPAGWHVDPPGALALRVDSINGVGLNDYVFTGTPWDPAWAGVTVTMAVTPDRVDSAVSRGVLEVTAQGRPGPVLVPLTFLTGELHWEESTFPPISP